LKFAFAARKRGLALTWRNGMAYKGATVVNSGEPNAPSAGETPAQKQKTCPACGAQFGCMAAAIESCWCAEVKLSGEATADLRARFADCLCPRCLALAAARTTSP
jgi:hypothetical protein